MADRLRPVAYERTTITGTVEWWMTRMVVEAIIECVCRDPWVDMQIIEEECSRARSQMTVALWSLVPWSTSHVMGADDVRSSESLICLR